MPQLDLNNFTIVVLTILILVCFIIPLEINIYYPQNKLILFKLGAKYFECRYFLNLYHQFFSRSLLLLKEYYFFNHNFIFLKKKNSFFLIHGASVPFLIENNNIQLSNFSNQFIDLYDLYFSSTEFILLIGLFGIMFQYSYRLYKIKNLSNFDSLYFYQIQGVGAVIVSRKICNLFLIGLGLMLCHPLSWTVTKILYNETIISTPELTGIKFCILLIGYLVLQANKSYLLSENLRGGDFAILTGYFILFCILLVSVINLLLLFLFLEIIAIISYLLISFRQIAHLSLKQELKYVPQTKYKFLLSEYKYNNSSTVSGLSASLLYFLSTAVITSFLLISMISFLCVCKSLNFNIMFIDLINSEINFFSGGKQIPVQYFSLLGLTGLIVVFLFKLGGAPFHFWIPAVFEGAPYITLMLLMLPFKIAVLVIFLKIFYVIFASFSFLWQPIFLGSGLLSICIGTIGLYVQNKIKKFWAYSSLTHIGYLLVAFGTNSFLGLRALFIYLVSYILVNLNFFVLLLALTNTIFRTRITYINQFSLLSKKYSTFFILYLSITIFSLIGIPPFLGFWGKFLTLYALFSLKTSFSFFILIFCLIATIIAAGGYLRFWKAICIEKSNTNMLIQINPIPIINIKILNVCSILLVFGIFIGYFIGFFFLDIKIVTFLQPLLT
jgi:NADH:ubiquinone oxidoreductase subunit 2 (subunit N)